MVVEIQCVRVDWTREGDGRALFDNISPLEFENKLEIAYDGYFLRQGFTCNNPWILWVCNHDWEIACHAMRQKVAQSVVGKKHI